VLSRPVGVLPAGFFFVGVAGAAVPSCRKVRPTASGARIRTAQVPSSGRRYRPEDADMAKGLDKKKEEKKKPAKTLKEKRADKQEKKNSR
jgi:hypothetical protein